MGFVENLAVFQRREHFGEVLTTSAIFYGNLPFCVLRVLLGDLGATYDDRLRLIGKSVVDFLLAIIELFSFFARCWLRRYERLSFQNRRFCSNGGRLTQNFRYKGSHLTNHSFSQKTRLNDLSYGV